ncbi:LuxR family transcriptional regulator [Pararhizobium mangrovi]|uniref:LuxR family transcriptional regulator n=1 Tax=Pararhizobium mangrovi TaxID=2590452 RepID=A0A506U1Z5_9HYPH|nr:LuxR family transcriptional regulator [Pararhizobium mangrovi]TPW26995.1 LuxR family transcriptional regulator [Pararhizobium mangrovi]
MSHDAILRFLEDAPKAQSPEALLSALGVPLSELGMPHYVVFRDAPLDAPVPDTILGDRFPKSWWQLYAEKGYGTTDPARRYLRRSQGGFRWSEALEAFSADPAHASMTRMMRRAGEHGLLDGYTFPVYGDRGVVGSVSMAGRPGPLPAVTMSLLDAVAKRTVWTLLRLCRPDEYKAMTTPVSVRLTRRELEALDRLSEGMTSHEIGRALEISSNTVDWYMNGIQSKLQARNRHHAVAIAFRLGLLV